MSAPQKLIAVLLAMALHLPLFILLDNGLQRGQADARQSSGRVAMTLAARPAAQPAPPTSAVTTPAPKPASPMPALPSRPAPPKTTPPQTQPPVPTAPPESSTQHSSATPVTNEDGQHQQRSVDALGLGGSADEGAHDSERARYLGQLQAAIERLKSYPQQARLRRQEGTVVVRFSITEDGRIDNMQIIDSSGSAILDRSVEQLFQRLRLPAPSAPLLPSLQQLTLPITFQLQTG